MWVIFFIYHVTCADLPSEAATTYEIHFRDKTGETPTENGSVDYGTYEELGVQARIVFDTPWNERPPTMVLQSKIRERFPESKDARRARLDREWRKRGYTPVETVQGVVYYPETWVQLAARARALSEESQRPHEANETRVADAVIAEEPTPTGYGRAYRYGIHAFFLASGLLLSFIVLRKTFHAT
jgi:hypothetical protein